MRGVSFLVLLVAAAVARGDGNLLRNGDFQDDWTTHLPELKNHHWNYSTEVYNRRDFNPDVWRLSGKWEWRDADRPRGQRKLILTSPSRVVQAVNWVTVNNSAKLAGWPDAGGFPQAEAIRSKTPLALVRDLTFRVTLSATNLPKDAAKLTLAWAAASPFDDPLGEKRTATASVAVPEGTYAAKTVEVKLPASAWLEVAKKDAAFAAQGALIPMAAVCEITFADKHAGTVELLAAELVAPLSAAKNLLPNGDFEMQKDGWPVGWSHPQKYRYFPPGVYYIFNTWHNSNSANRGRAATRTLVNRSGDHALQLTLSPGDETCVVSEPIPLDQKEARPVEVSAWVKTDQLAMLQIDAEDQDGKRIDGFNFIHKSMPSVGTDEWRMVRQVFRPAAPLKSMRLKLCARGTNGFTLDGTGHQPQQNATGSIWWDDVRLCEPESPPAPPAAPPRPGVRMTHLDLGEQLLGVNTITARCPALADGTLFIELDGGPGRPKFHGPAVEGKVGEIASLKLEYRLDAPGAAYTDTPWKLRVTERNNLGEFLNLEIPVSLTTWTVPIELRLGALYLRPDQKQFVRMNLGLSSAEMRRVKSVRLDLVRRGTGEVLKTTTVPATPDDILKQRANIPDGLRGDFRNLLLADLDASFLPVHPFADPQRNWLIRATVVNAEGKDSWSVESPPFCRLAHDGPQPPITSVRINERGDFLVNDKPWMPWGVTYGHNPVYAGPAAGTKSHDLANLKPWGLYDRHGGNLGERAQWDINCLRHVEGALVKPPQLEEMWKKGLYGSTVFLPPPAPGKPWPDDHLKYLRTAPMVAAVSRGPEEAFGHFLPMTPAQLAEVKTQADALRAATGKPVMVGHGGYWTRLELEKVPFFDIYDPETEPWYPAPVHTDLAPLVAGKRQAMWLRPQMYESVPFERWRYHVYVELMRGARGWQVAHGPGEASLMRGLHAELRHLQPFIYSAEKPPAVTVPPGVESMVRTLKGKTVIVAATTHGMSFGNWKADGPSPHGLSRVTADPHIFRDESDGYHATREPKGQALCPHGIQYLPNAKAWPAGSKLVTRVKFDAKSPPKNLVALVKADGRWTHAAAWGSFDPKPLRADNDKAFWFLRTFYRHARGFLGWGDKVSPQAMEFVPSAIAAMGDLPKPGEWVELAVPLDKIGATGKLLDGVGFLHDGGRVSWAKTVLVAPDGSESVVFGDHEDRPASETLAKARFAVPGLKKGTRVRVLFEDREIVAEDGGFTDDFRGTDLYQRYGGERSGYGNSPVALHVYEIAGP